jgi:hypothetical protein
MGKGKIPELTEQSGHFVTGLHQIGATSHIYRLDRQATDCCIQFLLLLCVKR